MALLERFGLSFDLRSAIAIGLAVALLAGLALTPRVIRKLRGAGIVGKDRQKPNEPEIPEMGGLAVFLAFNAGVFAILGLSNFSDAQQILILSSLVVCAGALVTGVLDDLIVLRQRFKAFIPFVFAAPLALHVTATNVDFPHFGLVGFGLLYSLVLVPAGIACASNGFNMLEGLNGLGAGLGLILAAGMSFLAIVHGNSTGLVILFPLVGALGAFLWFNMYPARVFPGDTMTLMVGAALGAGAILGRVEFWGALLFLPHIVEFVLKALGRFSVQSFATRLEGDRLVYEGPIRSLTHVVLRSGRLTEPEAVFRLWFGEAIYVGSVLAASVFI